MKGIGRANYITVTRTCKIEERSNNGAGNLFGHVFKLVMMIGYIGICKNFRQADNVWLIRNHIFHNTQNFLNHIRCTGSGYIHDRNGANIYMSRSIVPRFYTLSL